QVASGHSWHLQYAWLPLALYFFDVGLQKDKMRHAVYAGIVVALMVYMGAIYPLPHTALALGGYALLTTAMRRSARPLLALSVTGLTGIGFAAPKLLPM